MILAILGITIGLSFLSAALLEVASHWGRPLGVSIGIAGTVTSLLLILAAIAIQRRWTRARQGSHRGCGLHDGVYRDRRPRPLPLGSLHFMGTVAVALGMGFPIALLVGYLRGEQKEQG